MHQIFLNFMIKDNLKKIREWSGVTPYEIARLLGITRLKWFQIERGNILPEQDFIAEIEKKFLGGAPKLATSELIREDVFYPESWLENVSPIGDNIKYLVELYDGNLDAFSKLLSREFPKVSVKSLTRQMNNKFVSMLPKTIAKIEKQFKLEEGVLTLRSIRNDPVAVPEISASLPKTVTLSKFGQLLARLFPHVYKKDRAIFIFTGLFSSMFRCYNLMVDHDSKEPKKKFLRNSNSNIKNTPPIADVRSMSRLVYIDPDSKSNYDGVLTFKTAERWCSVLNNWSKDVPLRPFGAKYHGLCWMQEIFWHDLVEDDKLKKVATKLLTDDSAHLRSDCDKQIASELLHGLVPNVGGFWFYHELVNDKTSKKFVKLPFDPMRVGFSPKVHIEQTPQQKEKHILTPAASSCCMKFVGMPNTNVFGVELLVHWDNEKRDYGLDWLVDGDKEHTKMPKTQKEFVSVLNQIITPKINFS